MGIMINVVSILLGGGIFAFIEFLIKRHDSKNDKTKDIFKAIEQIKKDIATMREEASEREAIRSRDNILRFDDELYNNIWHSSEYFLQILDDIKVYTSFCHDHPKFANGRTESASGHIKQEYDRLYKEHKL